MLKFPSTWSQRELLPCPQFEGPSSVLSKRIWFYIHEWLLKPLSGWYCRFYSIQRQAPTYPLPIGLILKCGPYLSEREGLAMNLA